jgi:Mrp family chromosome partitioning ATPase
MVAKSSKTPKQALRLALDVLETDGVALSGIIFNGYEERRYLIGQNYSYGYYKSSRYGYANAYNYAAYGADNQSNS